MLFRKNLTVCSKPLTFEKTEAQEIDQTLLIRLRRRERAVGDTIVPAGTYTLYVLPEHRQPWKRGR
jgi:hypothetical protein